MITLIEKCSMWTNWQYISIVSNNSMVTNRLKAFIWNNDGIVWWRIYASLALSELKCLKSLAAWLLFTNFFQASNKEIIQSSHYLPLWRSHQSLYSGPVNRKVITSYVWRYWKKSMKGMIQLDDTLHISEWGHHYTPAQGSWRAVYWIHLVRPSVRPSVYWRHGFRSISQVSFGISISNFICMLMVAIGRSLLIFSNVTFKMAAWRPYWIFWFPDSNFTLALNINFKLQCHDTYVYE